MVYLFNQGYSSSSLNSARSALSFFAGNSSLDLSNDPTINKLFKYFYRTRPKKAKYFVYWPVQNLLNYLKSLYPLGSLSLKILTMKTLALVALSSSDRGQTINKMDIKNMHIGEESLTFVISDRLKNTRRVLKPKIIKCPATPDPSLSVISHVKHYIEVTSSFRRPEDSKLFLSWATKRPVSCPTLARWLKTVLKAAGIDTEVFSAHSYRGASLSSAYSKGVSLSEIVRSGDWSSTETFLTHYFGHSIDTPVGQIILSQSSPSQV